MASCTPKSLSSASSADSCPRRGGGYEQRSALRDQIVEGHPTIGSDFTDPKWTVPCAHPHARAREKSLENFRKVPQFHGVFSSERRHDGHRDHRGHQHLDIVDEPYAPDARPTGTKAACDEVHLRLISRARNPGTASATARCSELCAVCPYGPNNLGLT